MKIKAETLADTLRKANGFDRALRIAQSRAQETDPKNWINLPHGPVFFKKDKRGNEGLSEKHLRNLHGFWTHVYHILKKRTVNAK
jgi:hypothetical protein